MGVEVGGPKWMKTDREKRGRGVGGGNLFAYISSFCTSTGEPRLSLLFFLITDKIQDLNFLYKGPDIELIPGHDLNLHVSGSSRVYRGRGVGHAFVWHGVCP